MRRAERAQTCQTNTTKWIFLSHRCTHNRHGAFNIYFHVNASNPKQNVNFLWDNIMRINMNNESINNQSSISFSSLDTKILSSSFSNLKTPKRVSESSSASFFSILLFQHSPEMCWDKVGDTEKMLPDFGCSIFICKRCITPRVQAAILTARREKRAKISSSRASIYQKHIVSSLFPLTLTKFQ